MGVHFARLERSSPSTERTIRNMKLKHWLFVGFALLGVLYAYHYLVQHRGVNVAGMVGVNGTRLGANAGVGG